MVSNVRESWEKEDVFVSVFPGEQAQERKHQEVSGLHFLSSYLILICTFDWIPWEPTEILVSEYFLEVRKQV